MRSQHTVQVNSEHKAMSGKAKICSSLLIRMLNALEKLWLTSDSGRMDGWMDECAKKRMNRGNTVNTPHIQRV